METDSGNFSGASHFVVIDMGNSEEELECTRINTKPETNSSVLLLLRSNGALLRITISDAHYSSS